jgi:DnaD/phage-associated family protein
LIPAGSEYCVLRADAVDRLLSCGDSDGALLYLYLVRRGASFSEEDAMRDLHFRPEQLQRAIFTLKNLQIASAPRELRSAKSADSPAPRYTVSELRSRRTGDRRFEAVCQTAESVLGQILTESQLRTLYTAYDHLGLPADVLIDLLTYLKQEKNTVTRRDIEEQAYLWADMGIFTAQASAAFLSRLEQEKPVIADMLRALDMAGRSPSPSEYRYLSEFIRQGFGADAVALAKERLYQRLGRFSWKYLKGILDSWHDKGVHTVEEITALEPVSAPKNTAAPAAAQPDKLQDWEKDWLDQLHSSAQSSPN